MDRTKTIACVIALVSCAACSNERAGGSPIRVGSKNFTEQIVLGEIISQQIENRLHRKVDRRLNLGGTLLAHQALLSGDLDLYPEYTGTALVAVLKQPIEKDPSAVLAHVRDEYQRQFHLAVLDSLGFNNTFAMVIRGPDARAQHIETLSDAAKAAQPWPLGEGYEFESRADGKAALDAAYHLRWQGSPKTMDLGLLYKALDQNQVSMIAANATDGLLSKMDLTVLRDDQSAFPPYQACIVARQERLDQIPGLRDALSELSGKLTEQTMRQLNYQVDGEHRPVAEVANEFLKGLK